jgi:hypothetical protein
VGAGYQPRSVVDYQQVALLAQSHADLNRLGGLLKMWLTNQERMSPQEVAQLLKQITESNRQIAEAAKKIVRSR